MSVLDNLNTHAPASLHEAYAPEEARRILRRLCFHHPPKHASWLTMAEIEIGVLGAQCLDRRIPDQETLATEVGAWEAARNAAGARITWPFNRTRRSFKAQPSLANPFILVVY
jgi:hypothetical protein